MELIIFICGKYTKEVIGLVGQKGDKGDTDEKDILYLQRKVIKCT